MLRSPILLFLSLISTILPGQTNLKISQGPSGSRVLIQSNNITHLQSPEEGLWTIATGWADRWPAGLIHAKPAEVINHNSKTILTGKILLPKGELLCRDAYLEEKGLIRCTRRFEWTGTDTLKEISLIIRYEYPARTKAVVMPGILYHGNPSGENSRNTPVYHGETGDIGIFEEHRFPMPFVSAEWESSPGKLSGAALHSLPSPVPHGRLVDQWWSIGIETLQKSSEMVLYSGPCAFNGERSVIKALQGGQDMKETYDEAWISMPPGQVIEKTFWLQAYAVDEPGSAFQYAVRKSLDIFEPWHFDGLPGFREIVDEKLSFALTRYFENEDVAGFMKYPDRNFFVLGWCGQSAACGYAMQILQKDFEIPGAEGMVQKSLDFLSTSEFYESGFYTWYNIDKDEWFMNHTPEWLSQGQAMLNFANAIRVARDHNTSKWQEFIVKSSDFHSARILNDQWKPESTNEAFFIEPFCMAFNLTGKQAYLDAAKKAGKYYALKSLDMSEPYWGGTLDASCEDKEGAFAALQGFISLYETTKNPEYLSWARHAGDVCLSYVVVWDIPMPPGRLTDHAFKTRGWTAVSVQNMHIDVYGVLIAPYIYKLGQINDDDVLMNTARLMFRTCGQLIDPFGSQGEQPYHTNYIQVNWRDKPLYERRGNYLETWTVFWITAHFLNAAAMFEEMGVKWE